MQFSLLNNTSSLSFRLLKSKYFPFFFFIFLFLKVMTPGRASYAWCSILEARSVLNLGVK